MVTEQQDIDPKSLEGLGFSDTEYILAFRSRQGESDRYTFSMPIGAAVESIKRPDPDSPFPGNRRVEQARARRFAQYLRDSAESGTVWTCPPIQLRSEPDLIKSIEVIHPDAGLTKIGVPRHRRWDIQDGQHRALGFCLFVEEIEKEIADCRSRRASAERSDEPEVAAHYLARLQKAERVREDVLVRAHVEIVVVVADEAAHRQMFADIAIHAKGINPDFAAVLDQRDPVHRIATNLMTQNAVLRSLVNTGQSGRTSTKSRFLIGAKSLTDICHGVIVGPGRVGRRVQSEIENSEDLWQARITDFLSALFETFPDLDKLARQELTAPELRDKSLIASATMLRVLSIAWHELLYPKEPGVKAFTVGEAKGFFRKLEPYMRCFATVAVRNPRTNALEDKIGIPADHELWMPTGKFQPGNKAPAGAQGAVNDFGRIVAGWARHGLPVASQDAA